MHAFELRAALMAAAVALFAQAQTAGAVVFTSQEAKCAATLAKSIEKYNAAILKEVSRCRADDISGKVDDDDACATLSQKSIDKLSSAEAKMIASVAKACRSVCSISTDKPCINDVTCPPNNDNAERCSGNGGTNRFNVSKLGFPGPYCGSILEEALGRRSLQLPTDIGLCTADLTERLADDVVENLYGDLDETSGVSADAQKCLSAISKATSKALGKVHAAAARCRNSRQANPVCDGGSNDGEACANDSGCPGGGSCGLDPDDCLADATVAAALQKERDTLSGAIAKSCTDGHIVELEGLCSSGGTIPADVSDAQDCVYEMVLEVAAQQFGPYKHVYTTFGMTDVSHPASAFGYCGDGLVDQERNESNRIGEECDGDNDDACGGAACLPPGDLFECTCDNVSRYRMVVDGEAVDSDAGWTGDSHDATHNDGFGYTADLTDCDCSSFDQATCVGSSTDPVCNFSADIGPRCTNNRSSEETCDEIGDGDGEPEDADCFVCDDNSLNPGTYCADEDENADETVCLSQCFSDATGLPVDPVQPCNRQSDCDDGETCKGRCDDTPTCDAELEGTPLPQVAAAISVCIGLEYTSDLTGTKNMVTGESELFYTSRSVVHLGEDTTRPCPICAGSCVGGDNDGLSCFGRCNASGDECLLDSDCTGPGDSECMEAADDCPSGSCSLDLRCSSGDNAGRFCRPMSTTPLGIVSADCPPSQSSNLSGVGVQQPFGAVTTEPVSFPAGSACSDPAWSNFTCPCPDGGSATKTKPNICAATCDSGVNEGQACAVVSNGSGTMTKCAGGTEAGAVCDEDADCAGGGTCSANPTQCTAGGSSTLGTPCTTNSQCDTSSGSGDGVCGDACPGGRCLPLCYPQGQCVGGTRAGLECAQDKECTGGGACVVNDSEDGLCANGPMKWRCTGAGFTTLPCSLFDEHTQKGCEAGADGVLGNDDDIVGAGFCERRPLDCYVNNGAAEGWDTLNGGGDASQVKLVSTFCTPPASNPAVNSISGFGGPSRTRRVGQGYVNVPSIP
ncbi:MAG TPA: hypothetical protein VEC57_16450 [Candidatus Limnocylindrales bacterium]|nr:hypothetical protein [Candidatus Limnocylindrales bacterium]